MSAEGDGAGDGAEDPDAPAAELTPEERLSLEMDAFEARWGKKKRVAEERRRRLLWKVKINEADVETVARECELDADAADLRLREHGGDVESVLRTYIREEVRELVKMHPEDAENVELGLTEKEVFLAGERGTARGRRAMTTSDDDERRRLDRDDDDCPRARVLAI